MALEAITTRARPLEKIDAVPGDPTDNKVLECAVASGTDVIVSGDAHLLDLKEFRGIKIRRPTDFLAMSRQP
jgi:predicted nucleic acid-binding protein